MNSAEKFFSPQEQQVLVDSIVKAELKTTGEIRLHIENFCLGDELKTAMKIFNKLQMHQTNERNGVLIYIATLSRKIAIVGDVGIHEKMGNAFWNSMVTKIISKFKSNKKVEALSECIIECGLALEMFFPAAEGNKNELNNNISYR